jgi:hypothetical protein
MPNFATAAAKLGISSTSDQRRPLKLQSTFKTEEACELFMYFCYVEREL